MPQIKETMEREIVEQELGILMELTLKLEDELNNMDNISKSERK